ncbi:MAG: N-acetyltransferase [Methanosphaera sp.]|nr:N-acetyltransferase [Methanosphaera sp.]
MNKEEILQNYRIEKLKAHHKLNDFNCEKEGLNKFLKEDALEQQENNFNVTYLAIYEDIIIGYYSLLADYIHLKEVDFPIKKEFKNAPAIKIGRLARDINFKGCGLGEELLDNIYNQILKCKNVFGIKYITVDSYVTARHFYKKNRFLYINKINKKKLKKAEERNPNSTVVMYKDVKRINI